MKWIFDSTAVLPPEKLFMFAVDIYVHRFGPYKCAGGIARQEENPLSSVESKTSPVKSRESDSILGVAGQKGKERGRAMLGA